MGQIQSLEEFLSLLWRRKFLIVAITLLGTIAALAFALSRPVIYQSAAVIQVQLPTVGGTADPAAAPSNSAQMLQEIQQRLTTRENLVEVIKRHGLYADLPSLSLDKKVDLLRASVTFQTVASANAAVFGQATAVSALIIFSEQSTAELAARVANDFAQGILDQSDVGLRTRADENVKFFAAEEKRVWAQITALEKEIADYQNQHAETLPAQRDARRDQLISLDTDLRAIEQQRLALEGQKAVLQAGAPLRETERRTLEGIIAQLEVLNSQRQGLQEQRQQVNAAIAATPEVEAVLNGYNQQLQQLQDQYQVLNQRMAEAQIGMRLAENNQAERFTLLERALAPEYPQGGGRKKLAIAGALASLAGAIALAFVLDLVRPVVRTAAQMQRQTGLIPVVSIPELKDQGKARRGRGLLKLIDDPTKPLLGLPRYAVIAAAAALLMIAAAAAMT